jgi:16S rRNA (uracil1498-N3)-methyltransferase
MARFFIPKENIHGNRGVVVGEELRHMRRVLRLAPGDGITIFDDTGTEHEAVIRSFGAESAEIEIIRSREAQRESPLDLTLALGLTKGDKMDLVVEKATELGVCRMIPFVSTYSVAKLDPASVEKRLPRWQRIALSAAKQCGRTRIPEVLPICAFRELVRQDRQDSLKLLFWEKEARQSLRQVRVKRGDAASLLIVIGPEGGFSVEEAGDAEVHGFEIISLGRRILRAETAAVTAVSLVQFLWGDLN